MWGMASLVNGVFDIMLAPFRGMHPAIGLLAISVATGVIMLLIFGKTSNQDVIRKVKGRLKAHIAEIWLFRNDLAQMLLAVVRVLGNTGVYFVQSLRPLIFILVPVVVIMVMLGLRYELRPFQPGETAVLSIRVDDPSWTRGREVRLVGAPNIEVLSGPLRIPQLCEIDWRIRATAPGVHEITLVTPAGEVTKSFHVTSGGHESGSNRAKIAASRGRCFSSAFLLFPSEPPLPASSGVRKITVRNWPHRELKLLGWGVHWLIVFFVISMAAGFSVKGLFGVEV
ncbi:MAG: hypothetical protein KAY24_15880 [Candidatus Eisenbacteria sp.]|nr:hypothetical protein [Candidatus Eisenbacteria bacterium]